MLGEHVAYDPCRGFSLCVFTQDMMRNPFSMFDNVMANMRNRMEDMHRNFVSLLLLWYFISPSFVLLLFRAAVRRVVPKVCTIVCVFQESMSTDSNTHSFHSSSVMTYSKVGNEPPKVFQASTSTRCAPGGVSVTPHVFVKVDCNFRK